MAKLVPVDTRVNEDLATWLTEEAGRRGKSRAGLLQDILETFRANVEAREAGAIGARQPADGAGPDGQVLATVEAIAFCLATRQWGTGEVTMEEAVAAKDRWQGFKAVREKIASRLNGAVKDGPS